MEEMTLQQFWKTARGEIKELLRNFVEDPTPKSRFFAYGYASALNSHGLIGPAIHYKLLRIFEQLDDEALQEQIRALYE
jgi:hypothetical protein